MDKIEKKMEELEVAIAEAKEETSRVTGMLDTLLSQMKTRFGITSVEEVAEQLKKIKAEREEKQKELDKKYKKLRDNYEW